MNPATTTHGSFPRETAGVTGLGAIFRRELRAALLNRYLQVFSLLAIGAGLAAVATAESASAPLFFLLQISLYFVSLFAILIGVSAARAEAEEWPILLTQPVARWVYATGKFMALAVTFSAIVALLFAPALLFAGVPGAAARLALETIGIAAVFGSVGLCAGFFVCDRVQGLIVAVSAWILLLFGTDLAALLAAQWAPLQKVPDVWVALLMLNPLDAFRIQALFALEQIPPEAANKTPLANWWLTHADLWMAMLAALWTITLLALTNRRVAHVEI
jgi:ABC-2 type transport system permease protein/Cu-processing system permease protein